MIGMLEEMLGSVDALFGAPAAVGLMIAATTTPFPAELAALAVAMKFGFWTGLALIWTGSMLGATASHAAALWLRRHAGWITRARPVRVAEARMRDLGWFGVFGLRLIPLVPFFALSLAAGLIRVPLRSYLLGTGLGIVPGCALMSLLGQGLISGRAGLVAAAALGAVALPAMVWALGRRRDAAGRRLQPWTPPPSLPSGSP